MEPEEDRDLLLDSPDYVAEAHSQPQDLPKAAEDGESVTTCTEKKKKRQHGSLQDSSSSPWWAFWGLQSH